MNDENQNIIEMDPVAYHCEPLPWKRAGAPVAAVHSSRQLWQLLARCLKPAAHVSPYIQNVPANCFSKYQHYNFDI